MKKLIFFIALLSINTANAALITYTDRASFEASYPGLQTEDFEDVTDISQVLSSTNIEPGVTFSLTSGTNAYLAAPEQSSNPSQAIGVNLPRSAGWAMDFSIPVDAVALDIFQNNGGGSQFGYDIFASVDVFGVAGLLGSFNVTVPSGSAGFMGVFSNSDLITRLTINESNSFDVIDNVSFGRVSSVPVPAAAWLFGSGLIGLIGMRKKSAKF